MFLVAIHVVSYSLHSVSRFVPSYSPFHVFSAGSVLSISNVTVFHLSIRYSYGSVYAICSSYLQ